MLKADCGTLRMTLRVGPKVRIGRRTSRSHALAFAIASLAIIAAFPQTLLAMDVTLQWDANPVTDEVSGYRVYYKMDSAGERNLDAYKGQGLVLIEQSGTTRFVDSGFEILLKDLPDPNAPTVYN
jgi:hypothetical protein